MEQNSKEIISLQKLEEFEFHVGLKSNFWNPKMKDFIYGKKNNKQIIDIRKSIHFINKAYMYIFDLVNAGVDIMFVGVKNKNTSEIIKEAASRVDGFYVTKRWLGGLLTNFPQVNKTIKKLNHLEELINNEELSQQYTKKELLKFGKEKAKLEKFYSGIKNLTKTPSLLVVFNPVHDITAIIEAKKIGIPIVAIANTNANPELIDFIIPGNNKSPKSVYLIANLLCDAIAEAQGQKTLISFKKNEEIIFPEKYALKRNYSKNIIHKRSNSFSE